MSDLSSSYHWASLILNALVSWPSFAFVVLCAFRKTIVSFAEHVEVAKFPGGELILARRVSMEAAEKLPTNVLNTPPATAVPHDIFGAWNIVVSAARIYMDRADVKMANGKRPNSPVELETHLPMPERAIFSKLKRASSPARNSNNATEQAEREFLFVETAERLISSL